MSVDFSEAYLVVRKECYFTLFPLWIQIGIIKKKKSQDLDNDF